MGAWWVASGSQGQTALLGLGMGVSAWADACQARVCCLPISPAHRANSTHHLPSWQQAMAARMRPETLPAHEALYRSAEELAAKREALRRAADAAELKECLFHPVMVAGHKAKEGRAIKLAAELTQV